ncbi:MAG: antibiotic biosynthesis monooxygenase [Propionicimonas sp.]|uniref:GNAT family N-acetyltransferase n=1 Tax=Propionicimonas sp. TaxID=1955623 RepID=UPI002B20A2B2|nr:GNAT family N-acetyltransferase [Propionicimonas sp.]MEA4943533.1 antibiotic biosynthesis monooxygenase [Propionicimonas sp.]
MTHAPVREPHHVGLRGQLVCRSSAEAEVVRRQLPQHRALTRAEPGCLAFEVRATDDPLVWQVDERFVDATAFAAHQARVAASEWGRATAGIERRYVVEGLEDGEQERVRLSLLQAYDEQLRTEAEMANALAVRRLGPLWLATYAGGEGFISYRDLAGMGQAGVGGLVAQALALFEPDESIATIEWKTRGHDVAPGLPEALIAHGFQPEETESIMLGEATALAVEVPLPEGVVVRQIHDETDIRAMSALQDWVFRDEVSGERADALVRRHAVDDQLELWVAEVGGEMVSAGRLEFVPGTQFAGLWGGCTREEWRGKGIYRALTAARARSALAQGRTLLHSDSTEFSRPILERSGLIRASTTTPYLWRRS